MKAIKGVLWALCALFICQTSFAQSPVPKMRVNSLGDLEISDSAGKIFTFKSITLQKEVVIDNITFKVSFGPGAANGDLVAIIQPASAAKLSVRDADFPAVLVGISAQSLAIFTFNTQNHTLVVESGNLGTVTVNNVALKQGERAAVNADGSLVRNLGSGNPPAQPTAVAQNTPGAGTESENPNQPTPTPQETVSLAGAGNNMLASFAINLNPEASTPFLPGQ